MSGRPHHFDNPVYATCRPGLAATPLNNARLHNTILKNVNRSRERAGRAGPGQRHSSPACCEEDDMSDTTSEKGELHYMANE